MEAFPVSTHTPDVPDVVVSKISQQIIEGDVGNEIVPTLGSLSSSPSDPQETLRSKSSSSFAAPLALLTSIDALPNVTATIESSVINPGENVVQIGATIVFIVHCVVTETHVAVQIRYAKFRERRETASTCDDV